MDRAPRVDEVARLFDVADLRERVIVSLLTLGGFREGVLSRLQYRHVRSDLEAGTLPVHVRVEAEITKGKYAGYSAFIGREATDVLRLYLEERRRGSLHTFHRVRVGIPPEEITDSSPLIRDIRTRRPCSLISKQIRKIVHKLYLRAGLIEKLQGRMYELRTHSFRKSFKTADNYRGPIRCRRLPLAPCDRHLPATWSL